MTMRIFLKTAAVVAVLVVVAGCNGKGDGSGVAKDIVEAADEAELLFENDHVRAIEFDIDSGDELPRHECLHYVLYALSSCEIEVELNGVKSSLELKRGSAYWREGGVQSVENVGRSDAKFIALMRKESTLPEFDPADLNRDIHELLPDNSIMLLNGEFARAVEVILNPGQRVPGHGGLNRIVYSLTSYDVTYKESHNKSSEISFDEGDIDWYDAGDYAIANVGDSPAHFVAFQILK
jgi:hypothetical protein